MFQLHFICDKFVFANRWNDLVLIIPASHSKAEKQDFYATLAL